MRTDPCSDPVIRVHANSLNESSDPIIHVHANSLNESSDPVMSVHGKPPDPKFRERIRKSGSVDPVNSGSVDPVETNSGSVDPVSVLVWIRGSGFFVLNF